MWKAKGGREMSKDEGEGKQRWGGRREKEGKERGRKGRGIREKGRKVKVKECRKVEEGEDERKQLEGKEGVGK